MSDENWLPIWRGLAVDLLQEGFCSRLSVEKWARKNNFTSAQFGRRLNRSRSRPSTMTARFTCGFRAR